MNFHRTLLCIFALCLLVVNADIPANYTMRDNVTLVSDIFNLGYSPHQKYLVVLQNSKPGSFLLYDGIRLNYKKQILIQDVGKQSVSLSAYSFSQDGKILIIGSKEGGVYWFQQKDGQMDSQYRFKYDLGNAAEELWIKSVSISLQKKVAVALQSNFLCVLALSQNQQTIQQEQNYTFQRQRLTSVLWSPKQSNIIFVGGSGIQNGSFCMYDTNNKKVVKQISIEKTSSLAFSVDGSIILRGSIDKDIQIYSYQSGGMPTSQGSIPQSVNATQIWISQNQLYVAAQISGSVVKAWKVGIQQKYNLKNHVQAFGAMTFLNNLNREGSNLGLSSNGNQILIIPASQQSQALKYQLCQANTYYSEDQCLQCQETCKTCYDPNICLSCFDGKFIDADICKQCSSTLSGCQRCSDSKTCLSCNQTQNWIHDPQDGKCVCRPNYYNKGGVCSLCYDDLLDCQVCTDSNTCKKCRNENNFNPQPFNDKCICRASFWLNQTQCLECQRQIQYCQLCSMDGQKCQKCSVQNRHVNADSTKCICLDYNFQDPTTKQCKLCDQYQLCLKCKDQQSHECLECDQSKNRTKSPTSQGNCNCFIKFYDNLQGKCLLCSQAMTGCQECKSQKTCTLCRKQENFNPSPNQKNTCECIAKYTLSQDKQCKLCSQLINGCSQCSDPMTCTLCDQSLNFNYKPTSQGICECKAQFWLNSNVCEACSSKIQFCQTCSQSGDQCYSCSDRTRQPSTNKSQCECSAFYYQDQADLTCKLCDQNYNCMKCKSQGNHQCLECDVQKHWNQPPSPEGKCQCQSQYNQFNDTCLLCRVGGCTKCQSQATCSQCSQQKNFNPEPKTNTTCECKSGTYPLNDNTQCQLCSNTLTGCKQCDNQQQCTQCDQVRNFVMSPEGSKCQCNVSFYQDQEKVCQTCNSAIIKCVLCTVASHNTIQCYECQKGFGISQNHNRCINCSQASVGCENCVDTKTCLKCDQDNNFEKVGDLCKCISMYFLKNNEKCELCSNQIKGCITCDSDQKCLTCNQAKQFRLDQQSGKCVCIDGFYLDNDQCSACSIITGCDKCSSLTNCSQCNSIQNFQPSQNNLCQCKQSFWLNKTQCELCSTKILNCVSCSQDGQTCSKCLDQNRQLNQKHDKCQCRDYRYDDPMTGNCETCDQFNKCLHCQVQQPHICLKCDKSKNWNQTSIDGTCQCQDTYKQLNNICILCNIKGCSFCMTQGTCSQCQQQNQFNPQPEQNTCVCKNNSYTNQNQSRCYQCQQKLNGCEQCDNLQQCTKCNQNENFVLDQVNKQCHCMENYYLVGLKCLKCSQVVQNCEICEVQNQATQCNKCIQKFIPTQDKKQCLSCGYLITGCLNCTDKDTCQLCDDDNNFQPNDNNQCQCKKSYFQQNKQCLSCSVPIPGCTDCNGEGNQCLSCQIQHFILNQTTKTCYCQQSYFIKDKQCVLCSTQIKGCLKCTSADNSKTQCQQCNIQGNFYLDQQTKTCLCKQSYYLKDQSSTCQLCSNSMAGCLKCTKGTQCLSCAQNFILNETTKYCQCLQGYYLKDEQCLQCAKHFVGCKKCNNQTQCIECNGKENFIRNNQTKSCQCREGFFEQNDEKCHFCQQKSIACTKCDVDGCQLCNATQNFHLNQTNKECQCVEGYFQSDKQCKLCSSINYGCTKCYPNGSNCLQCNDNSHFVLNNQTGNCSCAVSYYQDSIQSCKLCISSLNYCFKCQSEFNGQGEFNDFHPKCLECKQGFSLSEQQLECECLGDDKQIKDGECVSKDSNNTWIYYAVGGAVVSIIAVGTGYVMVRKCRSRKQLSQDQYQALDQQRSNNKKVNPSTIMTQDNGRYNKQSYKSSQYQQ